MKSLSRLLAAGLIIFLGTAQAQDAQSEREQLIQFIKELAVVSDQGEACNEHMNYYAAKALEGAVCQEFKAAFAERWQTPANLMQVWDEHNQRVSGLREDCENCQVMIQTADEMRVKITYFLDYMEFIKGM